MIIFPMVGQSSRFYKVGYKDPKFLLPLWGETVLYFVLKSFESAFTSDLFVFITRADSQQLKRINKIINKLGIKNFIINNLESLTAGQAESVYLGTKEMSKNEEMYIFNVDTIRPNFKKLNKSKNEDGWLEVFNGEGDQWSFIEPGKDNTVIKTTEKNRVSNLCSNGLYYFSTKRNFDKCFEFALKNKKQDCGEYYIAPLYNFLIKEKKIIRYSVIKTEDIYMCGTPGDYEKLKSDSRINPFNIQK